MLAVSSVAIWGTTHGLGPFAQNSVTQRLEDLQLYLVSFDLTSLSLAAAVVAQRDSERMVLERTMQLERANAQFRELLESSPDAMVILDHQGQIVFVNAQTEKAFGYQRAEVLHRSIDVLVPKLLPARRLARGENTSFFDLLVRSIGSGVELSGLRRDGSVFPVEIGVNPLESESGPLISERVIRRHHSIANTFERTLHEKARRARRAVPTRAAHRVAIPRSIAHQIPARRSGS